MNPMRYSLLALCLAGSAFLAAPALAHDATIKADPESGLLMAGDWEIVKKTCTQCHSADVIVQTRVSRDRWEELLTNMVEEQGLKPPGVLRDDILHYLGKYYPESGKQKSLFPKDPESDLIMNHGWQAVKGTCSACHSLKLVLQNRGTRSVWEDRIRWMQKTQGLWDLGPLEDQILDYLAENYGEDDARPLIPGLPASLQQ